MAGSWLRGKRIWDKILSLYRTGAQPSCSPRARSASSSCLPFFSTWFWFFFIFFFWCPFKQEALPYGISQLLQLVVVSYLSHKASHSWHLEASGWRDLNQLQTVFTLVGLVFKYQFTLLFWHHQKDVCSFYKLSLNVRVRKNFITSTSYPCVPLPTWPWRGEDVDLVSKRGQNSSASSIWHQIMQPDIHSFVAVEEKPQKVADHRNFWYCQSLSQPYIRVALPHDESQEEVEILRYGKMSIQMGILIQLFLSTVWVL